MFQELGTILKTGLNQKWNLLADIIEHLSGKIVFRHRCMKMLKNMLPASYISPFPSSVLLCVIFILKHVLLATLSISWLICSLPRKLCKMRLSLFNCSNKLPCTVILVMPVSKDHSWPRSYNTLINQAWDQCPCLEDKINSTFFFLNLWFRNIDRVGFQGKSSYWSSKKRVCICDPKENVNCGYFLVKTLSVYSLLQDKIWRL